MQFDSAMESVTLQASDFADQIQMTGQPLTSVTLNVVGNLNSGGVDTLTGASMTNTWEITGASAGRLNTNVNFAGVESLVGGTQVDTFKMMNTASSMSKLAGGSGADLLDYSQFTTPVSVNLATGAASRMSGVSGIDDVYGGAGDDILIGNRTSYDNDTVALKTMLNDWRQTNVS